MCNIQTHLTHWGPVTPIDVTNLGHFWLRKWLVAYSAPSHYLNKCCEQCCNIVNLTLRNKLQSNCIDKLKNSWNIHENAFENVVWKMLAILSQPQCVNGLNYWVFSGKLLSGECHRTSLMICQHWLSKGLVTSCNQPVPEPMLTRI